MMMCSQSRFWSATLENGKLRPKKNQRNTENRKIKWKYGETKISLLIITIFHAGGKNPQVFLHKYNMNFSFCRIPLFEPNQVYSGEKKSRKMDVSHNYIFAIEVPWKLARLCSYRVDNF